jgi:hypothetical protein
MFLRFKSVLGTYHAICICNIKRVEIGGMKNDCTMYVFFEDNTELRLSIDVKQLKIIDRQLRNYNR